jgi:FkbM family methyltransferase
MKKLFSYWLPDDEHHFSTFINRYAKWGEPTEYQYQVRNLALEFVSQFDVSIDIGANLGLWSQTLEQKFKQNYSIEPIEDFLEYLKLNAPASHIIQTALGSSSGFVRMSRDYQNYGKNQICPDGDIMVPVQRLDELNLPPANLIKIDVEGFEFEVLTGGEQYIKSSYPILVIEQEQKRSQSTELLLSWGYNIVGSVKHDYIYKRS